MKLPRRTGKTERQSSSTLPLEWSFRVLKVIVLGKSKLYRIAVEPGGFSRNTAFMRVEEAERYTSNKVPQKRTAMIAANPGSSLIDPWDESGVTIVEESRKPSNRVRSSHARKQGSCVSLSYCSPLFESGREPLVPCWRKKCAWVLPTARKEGGT